MRKHVVFKFLPLFPTCRVATAGGRISLSSSGEVVNLTLSSTRQNDTGYWNCSAQVNDGANVVGQPVGRHVRLVVVGESTCAKLSVCTKIFFQFPQ